MFNRSARCRHTQCSNCWFIKFVKNIFVALPKVQTITFITCTMVFDQWCRGGGGTRGNAVPPLFSKILAILHFLLHLLLQFPGVPPLQFPGVPPLHFLGLHHCFLSSFPEECPS